MEVFVARPYIRLFVVICQVSIIGWGRHQTWHSVSITYIVKVRKKGKHQEWIQALTTPDSGYRWESDNITLDITNESKAVSPFPAGDHKASINRCACKHDENRPDKI